LHRIVQEITGKDLPAGVTEYNSNHPDIVGAKTLPDTFYTLHGHKLRFFLSRKAQLVTEAL
jgi:hypothetical protein